MILSKREGCDASAANRTRGPSMATMDFTTKPLTLRIDIILGSELAYKNGHPCLSGITTIHASATGRLPLTCFSVSNDLRYPQPSSVFIHAMISPNPNATRPLKERCHPPPIFLAQCQCSPSTPESPSQTSRALMTMKACPSQMSQPDPTKTPSHIPHVLRSNVKSMPVTQNLLC